MITVMIAAYAVSCLPLSLIIGVSIMMGMDSVIRDPAWLTILHTLCILQFSINFIIYTIIPSSVRDSHCALFAKIKDTFTSSCCCLSRRRRVSLTPRSIVDINYYSEESYL